MLDTGRPDVGARSAPAAGTAAADPEVVGMIKRVMEVRAETWLGISRWAKETDNLLPWQRSLAFSLGRLVGNHRPPSAKQAVQGLKILDESERRGFKREL